MDLSFFPTPSSRSQMTKELAPAFYHATRDDVAVFQEQLKVLNGGDGFVQKHKTQVLCLLEALLANQNLQDRSTVLTALTTKNVVFWLCTDLNAPHAPERVAALIGHFSPEEQGRILQADKADYAVRRFVKPGLFFTF